MDIGTLITGLIAGLGIGAILTAVVQHALKKREAAFESQRKDLEGRYRVIILLMYAAVEFEKSITTLRINRPDLKSKQDVLDELDAECYNMTLFSTSKTIHALRTFIDNPTSANLHATALCMRADLGRSALKE